MTVPAHRQHAGFVAWPTVALGIAVVLGHLATWAAVLTGTLPLWAGLLVNTVLAYIAFTPVHEAVHGNVGGSRRWAWLDDAVGWASALLLCAPFPTFRLLHLRHHGHTNDPDKDPDFWVAGSNALMVALRCWTIVPHYYYAIFFRIRHERAAKKIFWQSVLTIAALVGVGAALTALGLGAEVLALWVVPGWLASGALALLLDWLPHVPHNRRGRFVDTRAVVVPGLQYLTLWQSLHLVHHLYPRVVFYRYGYVFDAIRDEAEANGAEVWQLGSSVSKP